mgnify:CR=1 FL=1
MKKILKYLGWVLLLLVFVILTEGLASLILMGSANLIHNGILDESILVTISKYQIVLGQLIRGILIYFFIKFENKRKSASSKIIANRGLVSDSWKMLVVGFGVAGLGNIIVGIMVNLLKDTEMYKQVFDIIETTMVATNPMDYVILFVGVVILAPIVEELMFRGLLLNKLMDDFKPKYAIILSALAFGIYHFNVFQGVNTFAMGIILATVYYYRRNITDCIIIHMANNLFAVVAGHNEVLSGILVIISFICMIISVFIIRNIAKNNNPS